MDDSNVLDFKTAGMQRAGNRDSQVSKGRQFGIGNFFSWAMQKYPRMTLAQLEQKMPQLEREYGQEKTMRKAEPDMKPSVNSAFDDRDEEMKAKGIPQEGKSPHNSSQRPVGQAGKKVLRCKTLFKSSAWTCAARLTADHTALLTTARTALTVLPQGSQ